MGRFPIRIRLTLAFAVAMAVVFAATGLFLYLRLGSALDRTVDQGLRARATVVTALAQQADAGLRASNNGFAQLIGTQGKVVDWTPGLTRRSLLSGAQLSSALQGQRFFAGTLDGDQVRLLAVPVMKPTGSRSSPTTFCSSLASTPGRCLFADLALWSESCSTRLRPASAAALTMRVERSRSLFLRGPRCSPTGGGSSKRSATSSRTPCATALEPCGSKPPNTTAPSNCMSSTRVRGFLRISYRARSSGSAVDPAMLPAPGWASRSLPRSQLRTEAKPPHRTRLAEGRMSRCYCL